MGSRCEIGIIETPNYPPLNVSTPTKFTLFANPDYELDVTLRTGTVNLLFRSTTLTFSPTITSVDISIIGIMPGIYTIHYEIGGRSSQQFQQPEPSTLIVQPPDSTLPVYFTSRNLEPGMLEAGSCQYVTPLDYTCANEDSQILFSSTCLWHDNVSPGVIFSEYGHLSLPVAIAGGKISNTNLANPSRVVPLMGHEFNMHCYSNNQQTSCTFKPPNAVQEIQNFLRTEALAYTFLSQTDQLIPRWLQFSVNADTERIHDSTSYMIDLVESSSLSEIEECANIFSIKDGMYSVLKYSGSLKFTINSTQNDIASQGSPVCFVVNLCEGLNSPLLITIPDQAQDIVDSLSFTQILKNYGWNFTINSIAISSTAFTHELSGFKDNYWFGNQEVTYLFLDSNIIANGKFTRFFSLGNLLIKYSLEGRTYLLYNNFEKVHSLDKTPVTYYMYFSLTGVSIRLGKSLGWIYERND